MDKAFVEQRLASWTDPNTGLDPVSAHQVRGIGIDGDKVALDIAFGYPMFRQRDALTDSIRQHLEADPAITSAVVTLSARIAAHEVQGELKPHPKIRNIIAVASAKGGVGKSTTAVNLALGLQAQGARVGLLDADIYGPSVPLMLGLTGKPDSKDGHSIEPMLGHGLQCQSIGPMVEQDTAMIWRGPMVTKALQQLINDTNWQELDYLVIDMPPGTGDIQLTLSQKIPVAGAVIVTTPQEIALRDAVRGLNMFKQMSITVLGVVENMSLHVCSNCGHESHLFGSGGGETLAREHGVELISSIPLDVSIRTAIDAGAPTVIAEPDSPQGERYIEMATRVAANLAKRPKNRRIDLPKIVVQSNQTSP